MSSRFARVPLAALAACVVAMTGANARSSALRVCADPNNLPFSNEKQEGFENRIAQVIAHELEEPVEYTWWAQRRGFLRETVNAGHCDLVVGIPSTVDMVLRTRPYYRSTYVVVTRRGGPVVHSFDDSVLRHVKVGVQMVGDDFTNTPPAHALSRRGIIDNVRGYSVQGDYRQPNPPARIMEAVARGDIDVAVVWGPLAGYFARHSRERLVLTPVSPQIDLPFLPFVFDIAMGVRRPDTTFRNRLDSILVRRRPEIDKILADYGVPVLGKIPTGASASERSGGTPAW
jgi:mxaJ protein